jgi:hypothetical protein
MLKNYQNVPKHPGTAAGVWSCKINTKISGLFRKPDKIVRLHEPTPDYKKYIRNQAWEVDEDEGNDSSGKPDPISFSHVREEIL